MLGTHSLNSILGLDSNTRLPSISSYINEVKGTSSQPILVNEGVTVKPGLIYFDKLYKMYKYREFSIIWSIKENKYIITEVYQNGIKIGLDLPVVTLHKTYESAFETVYYRRSIFIYRGEEKTNLQKEICVLYTSTDQSITYKLVNTVSCY